MKQLAIRLSYQKTIAKSLVMSERVARVRSRLTSRATQVTAKRRQTGVAFFLVTFSLAKQEKVTSCRATPDNLKSTWKIGG